MRRIRHENRLLLHPKLPPKIRLIRQIESARDALIRLRHPLELQPAHIVRRLDHLSRGRAERHVALALGGHGLDGVRDDGFRGAVGGVGEVEGPLDLPAVFGRELSEDDHRTDLPTQRQHPSIHPSIHET